MRSVSYIVAMLKAIGVNPRYKGYLYLVYMLGLTYRNPDCIYGISGKLYPLVTKRYNVSAASVERNVRFAIKQAWENTNNKNIHDVFSDYNITWQPTICEFISVATNCLLLDDTILDDKETPDEPDQPFSTEPI